jgi:hypothetical protein
MLYVRLATLAGHVDVFVVGHANVSFSGGAAAPLSLAPFAREFRALRACVHIHINDMRALPRARSRYRDAAPWGREATARNALLDGVRRFAPAGRDLILLCDVDEVPTRAALAAVRADPPAHYYNLCGDLFHYSYRWRVGRWLRPLVIRYGALARPLDDYKFEPFRCTLPGVMHNHCSFCFPTLAEIARKLRSFSHVEYAGGNFSDPNYIIARILCGYGVLPERWRMPERLTLTEFDPDRIFLPSDPRLRFLSQRIGFTDLGSYRWDQRAIRRFFPPPCAATFRRKNIRIRRID